MSPALTMFHSSSFAKQGSGNAIPTVQARPVATPVHSRRGVSPSRARFNSDSRVPTAVVVPGATEKRQPVMVHAFSAQSLPGLGAGTAQPTAMCRSRSFTGEVMHSTPRVMQRTNQTPRNAATNSWVPAPIPSVTAAVSYLPPPPFPQSATAPGIATSWAPALANTPSMAQFPFSLQAPTSFVQAPAPSIKSTRRSATQSTDGDPNTYAPDTEVVIGHHRFRCIGVLGRGSFGEVWCGEALGSQDRLLVALKEIHCGQADLQQALFEAKLLQDFASATEYSHAPGAAPPRMRVPRYLSHRVDARKDGKAGNRIRMAMTRVPGEPLDAFLKRSPPPGHDVQSAVRRGCMLARALIRQLAPTLEQMSQKAIHRDVNAHNVLLSDSIEGGPFKCNADPEEAAARASFWLIDFGLAVDSPTWPTAWRVADIGGDCRYWPQSSWFVSFWGADEMAARKDLLNQYLSRLDIFGLAITALELLCTTALDGSNAAGCQNGPRDGLRGSWRRLLNAWTKYWTDVTRWHTMIYRVFSHGGDVGPLYQELAKEHVVDKILSRMSQIRQCLRDCVRRTEDTRIQNLLNVLANMLDESSSFGFQEAMHSLGGESLQREPSNASSLHSKPILAHPAPPPAGAPFTAPQTNSFVPPVVVHTQVQQSADNSYAPPPANNSYAPPPANNSYTPPIMEQKGTVVAGLGAWSFRPNFAGA